MGTFFDIINSTALIAPEERLALHAAAASVPEGGVIVEVGAFRGLSAILMRNAAPKNCRVYSIDPYPQEGTLERLQPYDIQLIEKTSREFATNFDSKIDLLLIDGDHSFYWAKEDFDALAPHLNDGAMVAFHDAGVTAFWGIRLILDALTRQKTFTCPPTYLNQLAIGKFDSTKSFPSTNTYVDIAKEHLSIQTAFKFWETPPEELFDEFTYTALSVPQDLDNVRFIGRGLRGWLTKQLLGLPGDIFINSQDATEKDCDYYVASAYFPEIYKDLSEAREIPRERIHAFTEFSLSVQIYQDILNGCEGLVKLGKDDFQREFLKQTFSTMPDYEVYSLHQRGMLAAFLDGLYRGWAYDFND